MGRKRAVPLSPDFKVREMEPGTWVLEQKDDRHKDGIKEVGQGTQAAMLALWDWYSRRKQVLVRIDPDVAEAIKAYLDNHKGSRPKVNQQAVFDQAIRSFLIEKGYLE